MRYLLAFSLLASFSTQVSALIPVVNVILASNDTPSKCITATNSNGALVTVQACTGTVGQRWTLQNGVVRIPSWNKCLDVKDGVNADGIKLQVWDCPPTFSNPNQQFSIQSPGPSTTLTWVGHNKCVDLTNGNTNDGTQLQIWTCSSSTNNNQIWTPDSGLIITFPGHPIHPGQDSTKCLTAPTNANNAKVIISDCVANDKSQEWDVGAYIRIYGDKCLDVTNGSTSNGVKMQIYTCATGNKNQMWIYDNDHRFIWNNGGAVQECLDLTNGDEDNGTPIQMWKCGMGNVNQIWYIG